MNANEMEQITKNLRKMVANLDDPYNLIQYAEMHFQHNVPRVEDMPTLAGFNLPNDPEKAIAQEEEKAKEALDGNRKMVNVMKYIIFIPFLAFLLIRGETVTFISLVWLVFVIPVITDMIFDKRKKQATQNAASELKERYRLYKDRALAYSYWVNVRNVSFWDSLDGHQFENRVADLYRQQGYQAKVSNAGGDGGIDIVLSKENESPIVVQCKAHSKPVAPAVARDLYGTMLANGYSKALLVSKSGFTAGVLDFVKDKPIELIEMKDLIRMAD